MAEKLERFLAWRGWRTQAFSAGARRRAKLGAGSSSFFEKKSDQAGAREQVAKPVGLTLAPNPNPSSNSSP